MTDVSTSIGKALPMQEVEKIQTISKHDSMKSKTDHVNADANVTELKDTNTSAEQIKEDKQDKQIDKEELEHAVASLNQYVQTFERKLDFQLDEESGVTVIKVYDATDEKLIRQIPNEEALTLAQHLNQQDPPHLFSAQV